MNLVRSPTISGSRGLNLLQSLQININDSNVFCPTLKEHFASYFPVTLLFFPFILTLRAKPTDFDYFTDSEVSQRLPAKLRSHNPNIQTLGRLKPRAASLTNRLPHEKTQASGMAV